MNDHSMKNLLLFVVLAGFNINSLFSQESKSSASDKINWISFGEAVEVAKKVDKKIMIDVYTTWCGPCKMMDKQTFTDPEIIKFVNEHYIPVKFNAEQKDPIEYNGKTYNLNKEYGKPGKGAHELALSLLSGQLSYPSFVFLHNDFSMDEVIRGFRKPNQMGKVLKKNIEKDTKEK